MPGAARLRPDKALCGHSIAFQVQLVRHDITWHVGFWWSSWLLFLLLFVVHGIPATHMYHELYNTAHHAEETSTENMSLPLVFEPAASEMQPNGRGPSSLPASPTRTDPNIPGVSERLH
ncbi:uncharacterized protein F5147DRAFT_653473 [Suillus discolor]|uniref:Uncharacterized protein n=1 Tax=Suillus discolor TaxID=1912936 RepID=A0A9P7F6V8_9AGAM|nr:uncharacterized protein F5147DRAFT_653473 [Suillus discolor]KAG2107251.1 hypothetical protein F5147DRAFT_653473 [Suillus discolor]